MPPAEQPVIKMVLPAIMTMDEVKKLISRRKLSSRVSAVLMSLLYLQEDFNIEAACLDSTALLESCVQNRFGASASCMALDHKQH